MKVKASSAQISRLFSGRRIFIPIVIGVGIAIYFIWRDFDYEAILSVKWRKNALIWLIGAFLMIVLRDFGYILRLRILSERKLSWRQCFEIALLWEFASAISPGAIGGTAVAFLIMAQEKMKAGLTTAIVIVTAFLDELFYIIMVPLLLILIGGERLIPDITGAHVNSVLSTNNLLGLFWVAYGVLALWTLFLFIALFYRPVIIKRLIMLIFRLPVLRKKKTSGQNLGRDLVLASKEFRGKTKVFWVNAFMATFLSWTARFMVLNSLLMAFAGFNEHILAYGRQLVMWVILLLPVTPGASGIAEGIFPVFIGEFLPDIHISRILALVWRMLSYYPYILIGIIILPLWLKRVKSKPAL
ncbi:MAG: flippase-like domain-containing protein [Flavobacteriales bacterium]|nr:flippase-like domain-containing protein [Flavobacteriales bacterium]